MSKAQQVKYDKYLETFVVSESEINTARYEGKLEGRDFLRSGKRSNRGKTNRCCYQKAYHEGLTISSIAKIIGSSEKYVREVLDDMEPHNK